jgi:signal transduction histidine kinase/ActR/RegA family two-component response regulator
MSLRGILNFFAFLLFCQGAFASPGESTQYPHAQQGVLDLRTQNFSEVIPLTGEWQFFWKRLLDPQAPFSKRGQVAEVPGKWNDLSQHGKKLPAFGYATYRLRILLPPKTGALRIEVPDVYTSYSLFINGKLACSNGRVSTRATDFVPYWERKFVYIPPGSDTLDLTLQIANFAHRKGGSYKPLRIGKNSMVSLQSRRSEAIDLLLTGAFLMGGFFFLGLYLLGSRDKAILFFSLFSIIYSYRIIGVDNYVLHTILPDISWYVTVRLEYVTFFSGMGLFALYTFYLFNRDINKRFLITVTAICFALAMLTIATPAIFFTRLIDPFLGLMLICMVYLPFVYIRAYKNKRPGAIYSLLSAFALILIFGLALIQYWRLLPPFPLLKFSGYIIVLSHRVSFALTKARLEAEQGLKAKSEFLSTMSHEIRTPLNSVIGMSHLLLKSDPRQDQIEQLDVMLFSANNLLAIVNDILDFNKIEAGKISFENIEMDIAAIARNIIKGLQLSAQDRAIELRLKIDENLQGKVMGDPTRMFQVISNLVHNAVKFTRKGYVELSIEVEEQSADTLKVKVQVKDSGIGISRQNQKLIFERFTQADSSTSRGFGGTGLGLAICKRILELQNSELKLQSQEGVGSTFSFVQTFQKTIKTAVQQELENNVPKQEDKPFSGMNILLVDDNPMNVMVAQGFLKRWGANIDVAVNGLEAVNKVDENRHSLVLIDLHMPVMDGYEATRQMRVKGISIPIIALTANLPSEIEQDVFKAGMNDLVVKPFLPDELYRKVLQQLYKSSKTAI